MDLNALEKQLTQGLPPVASWTPEHCGDIAIRIDRDGRWHHEGKEIRRMPLVKLFCRILRPEDGEMYLVTPVEKMRIQVDIEPFILIDGDQTEEGWIFETLTGEIIPLSANHPLELAIHSTSGDEYPRVKVRDQLFAHFHRNLYYRLAEQCREIKEEHGTSWWLQSQEKEWLFGRQP